MFCFVSHSTSGLKPNDVRVLPTKNNLHTEYERVHRIYGMSVVALDAHNTLSK